MLLIDDSVYILFVLAGRCVGVVRKRLLQRVGVMWIDSIRCSLICQSPQKAALPLGDSIFTL
jgi:hypothetical protein